MEALTTPEIVGRTEVSTTHGENVFHNLFWATPEALSQAHRPCVRLFAYSALDLNVIETPILTKSCNTATKKPSWSVAARICSLYMAGRGQVYDLSNS